MRLSEEGFAELKADEAYRKFAYPDVASKLFKASPKAKWGFRPASAIFQTLPPEVCALPGGPWTVGYGQTEGVTPSSVMTLSEAEANLRETIRPREDAVMRACTVTPTQGQFDALVNLAWNVMAAVNPRTSTIIKAHNRKDWASAARAFDLYNMAKGVPHPGLTLRRKRGAVKYLAASPVPTNDGKTALLGEAPLLLSQVVDAERPPIASTINRSSIIAGSTAAAAAVTETTRAVLDVKASVSELHAWLLPIALLAVVGLCIYIFLERRNMRKKGWV